MSPHFKKEAVSESETASFGSCKLAHGTAHHQIHRIGVARAVDFEGVPLLAEGELLAVVAPGDALDATLHPREGADAAGGAVHHDVGIAVQPQLMDEEVQLSV